MASKKISQLPISITSSLSAVLPIVDNNTTYQLSLDNLKTIIVDNNQHTFTGSQTILGDLTVLGTLYVTQSVSNSIVYNSTGSNKFGDSLDDTHQFTGSVLISNSLYVNGIISGAFIYGDASNLINLPTGSLLTTASFNDISSSINIRLDDISTGSIQKDWYYNVTRSVNYDEAIVSAGNFVLQNSMLHIKSSSINNSITITNLPSGSELSSITFNNVGKLYVGGYLLLMSSSIINDGEIDVAGCILLEDSFITGSGQIISASTCF